MYRFERRNSLWFYVILSSEKKRAPVWWVPFFQKLTIYSGAFLSAVAQIRQMWWNKWWAWIKKLKAAEGGRVGMCTSELHSPIYLVRYSETWCWGSVGLTTQTSFSAPIKFQLLFQNRAKYFMSCNKWASATSKWTRRVRLLIPRVN